MERFVNRAACLLLLLCTVALTCPGVAADDVPMTAMRDEMARSVDMQLSGLAKPYFLAYRIQEITDVSVSANLGSLVTSPACGASCRRLQARQQQFPFARRSPGRQL